MWPHTEWQKKQGEIQVASQAYCLYDSCGWDNLQVCESKNATMKFGVFFFGSLASTSFICRKLLLFPLFTFFIFCVTFSRIEVIFCLASFFPTLQCSFHHTLGIVIVSPGYYRYPMFVHHIQLQMAIFLLSGSIGENDGISCCIKIRPPNDYYWKLKYSAENFFQKIKPGAKKQ